MSAALLLVHGGGEQADRSGPTKHVVEMREMGFQPAELDVHVGDTIVWINRDVLPHTATDAASGWSSPAVEMGGRWELVVPNADTVRYTCTFHPVMKGRLVVSGAP